MGNTKAYFIALWIVVGTAGQCFADTTGNEIREMCQISLHHSDRPNMNSNDGAKAGFCLGFTEAIITLGDGLAEPGRFCHPNGVTIGQAYRVLLKYLDEHPERTNERAVLLALLAFKEAWPCH
jgi:hypothetical protein